ncbi:MAG: alpha/beta fold hydrolase [Propionibacteriales bacterium]|nr:alpha/beta fold hydrolase [Propionibacteriales bacterium]
MTWPSGGIFGDEVFRRGFVDTSQGQVHYRYRQGSGRPLVLFHASPGSAAMLLPLMARIRPSRSVYALDTLGNGDSCPPSDSVRGIEDFAHVAYEAMQGLGLSEVDVYGSHTGAHLAVELALTHPARIKHLVIDGMGLYSRSESADFEEEYCPAVEPTDHGSHLAWVWHFVTRGYMSFPWFSRSAASRTKVSVPDPDFLHIKSVEVLKALSTFRHSYLAAFRYPKREKLAQLSLPCLVTVGEQDVLAPYFKELSAATPAAVSRFIEADRLETHFDALARVIDEFLDDSLEESR